MSNAVADHLQRVLDHLRKNGWRQFPDDILLPPAGEPCCVTMAVAHEGSCNDCNNVVRGHIERAIEALLPDTLPVGRDRLILWNDAPGRTFAQVETVIERAIQDARTIQ